jgi:hypothetical protein
LWSSPSLLSTRLLSQSSADWRLCSWQLEGWNNGTERDSWSNPVDAGENKQGQNKHSLTKHVELKSLQTE